MNTPQSVKLGFPPPLLGSDPRTLEAQVVASEWIALEKPSGIELRPDSASPSGGTNLENALQMQAKRSLASLIKLGISGDYTPRSIYSIDQEIHGFGIWALNDAVLERLRNDFGSDKFEFQYEFFAKDGPKSGEEYSVYLPIAQHSRDPSRFVVSTKTGKKAETDFKKLKTWPKAQVALWSAKTHMPRGHQIRLHAFECGIDIFGESIYSSTPGLALTDLKRKRISKWESASQAIWPALNMRLAALNGRVPPSGKITFPRPRAMDTLLKKLDQFAS